jgi:RNA polymerase sigma-70 factor (ECF subfamily)
MPGPDSTRWTLIQAAAEGDAGARSEFARRYEPVVRAYLGARWRRTPLETETDDAVQEVFVDCFREGGPLGRVDPARPERFRAFLYGVVKNLARRFEDARRRSREVSAGSRIDLDDIEGREEALSRVFDRAWASLLLQDAVALQAEWAREKGKEAERRLELLLLRFDEDLPIREIARRWEVDPSWLHRQYARAREEYKRALREVVRDLQGGTPRNIELECARLLAFFE